MRKRKKGSLGRGRLVKSLALLWGKAPYPEDTGQDSNQTCRVWGRIVAPVVVALFVCVYVYVDLGD